MFFIVIRRISYFNEEPKFLSDACYKINNFCRKTFSLEGGGAKIRKFIIFSSRTVVLFVIIYFCHMWNKVWTFARVIKANSMSDFQAKYQKLATEYAKVGHYFLLSNSISIDLHVNRPLTIWIYFVRFLTKYFEMWFINIWHDDTCTIITLCLTVRFLLSQLRAQVPVLKKAVIDEQAKEQNLQVGLLTGKVLLIE